MPTLRLDGIEKTFRGAIPTVALRDVTVSIAQGEFVAIEGRSGGGKSTLLNVIGLLDTASGGSYVLGDLDTARARRGDLARMRSDLFGFIFQSFHLLDRRIVLESVELALQYRGVSRSTRRALALQALDEVGLVHLAYQTPNKLSGGERQRVAIARAIATRAPIIVADEPTGNLDTGNSQTIVDSLIRMHDRGATVILVTHSPEVAARAPRRLHIQDGTLADASSPDRPSICPQTEELRPEGRASTQRISDVIVDAVQSVTSRLGRSAGLVAAVAVAVGLAVATLGISSSSAAQVTSTFNEHTSRDVSIAWSPSDVTGRKALNERQQVASLHRLAGTSSAGIVENYSDHSLQLGPERPSFQVTAFAMTPGVPEAGRMTVRWAPGHPKVLRTGEGLIGATLASQVDLGPLEGAPGAELDGRAIAIVGIVEASPRVPGLIGGIVAGTSDRTHLGLLNQTVALVLTKDGAASQVARQAAVAVDPYDPTALKVDAPVDPSTLRSQVQSDLQTTLLALTAIALLAAIAGLGNAMMLSVLERKQEFGLRRALGARPVHVVSLILTESALIGAAGGLGGLIVGVAVVLVDTIAHHWAPTLDPTVAPLALAGGIVVGALGGTFASIKASRVSPTEALRL